MKVEELKKEYKDEWLLIKVEKTNELNEPIEGTLVAHSKSRDEIYEKMKDVEGHTYTVYAGEIPKKGYAVAFHGFV